MKSIQEILHFENIMRVIEEIKGGVPGDILPDSFFRATDSIIGNTGTYTKVQSTREVAQAVMYGAPSKQAQLKGVSKVPVTCIHFYEHFFHDPNTVALLKSENGGEQRMGAELAARKLKDFMQRFVNVRRATWYQALTQGKIYLDAEGNLEVSASKAVITIDFGIPAGNKSQLNALGLGNIIAASWATATTPIPTHITQLQKASAQLTGYKITTAYYGAAVPQYVAANTSMKEFLKMIPSSNIPVQQGQVPNGFCELKWVPAYNAFFTDAGGTARHFWNDDMIVFTPDETDGGWKGLVEGSYAIPTDMGQAFNDIMAALGSLQTIFGLFAYATVVQDPVTIKQYAGDTFLPTINVPKSVFIADVVF